MAKDVEKSILEELKRFNQINHNSDNLNEQNITSVGNNIGGVGNLGMGSHIERLAKRVGLEMAEQEVPAEDELEVGTEDEEVVDTEEGGDEGDTAIEDEMDMDTDIDTDMGDEDTTELDVTDLVTKQDEVNTELSDQKDILSKNTKSLDDLMTKLSDLEGHLIFYG